MPLFALICHDRPGHAALRQQSRAAHLANAEGSGVLHMGGPFPDDAGGMIGSLVILDVDDRAAAEAWAAKDPYARAGLFESMTILPWKKVLG